MNNLAESFFHAMLFTLIWAARLTTVAENHSYHGRSDIEIIKNKHHYIVELKIADDEAACEQAADDAMAQIQEKGYADRFGPGEATLIGIAVDRQARLKRDACPAACAPSFINSLINPSASRLTALTPQNNEQSQRQSGKSQAAVAAGAAASLGVANL